MLKALSLECVFTNRDIHLKNMIWKKKLYSYQFWKSLSQFSHQYQEKTVSYYRYHKTIAQSLSKNMSVYLLPIYFFESESMNVKSWFMLLPNGKAIKHNIMIMISIIISITPFHCVYLCLVDYVHTYKKYIIK